MTRSSRTRSRAAVEALRLFTYDLGLGFLSFGPGIG